MVPVANVPSNTRLRTLPDEETELLVTNVIAGDVANCLIGISVRMLNTVGGVAASQLTESRYSLAEL
jgi:hypothetical protein